MILSPAAQRCETCNAELVRKPGESWNRFEARKFCVSCRSPASSAGGVVTRTTALPISEAAFQRSVIDLAQHCGFTVFHVHDSRKQVKPGVMVGDLAAAGYPDLTLCRPPRLIAAELKAAKGRVTAKQQAWLDLLARCPSVEVYVWRPADWEDIVEVLR